MTELFVSDVDYNQLKLGSTFLKNLEQNQNNYRWNIVLIISKIDGIVSVESGLLKGSEQHLLEMNCKHSIVVPLDIL